VYRRRQHVISLTAAGAAGRSDSAPARAAAGGYNLLNWTDKGVAYWAVSDLNGTELEQFANLFRTAPENQ
jgi:anti-sigma factor RsiW